MEIEWKILLLNTFIIFPISLIIKASLHFTYLKILKDEFVKGYETFEEAYSFKKYNGRIQSLMFPWFIKKVNNLNDLNLSNKLTKLEYKIYLIIVYQWIVIGSIVWLMYYFG